MTYIRDLNEAETAEAIAQEDAAVTEPERATVLERAANVKHFNTPKPVRASEQIDRLIAGLEQRIAVLRSLKNSL